MSLLHKPKWKIDHGTLQAHCDNDVHARHVQEELQSINGSKIERDGNLLYCVLWTQEEYAYAMKELNQTEEQADQHTCDLEDDAVTELAGAGYEVMP